MTDLFYTALTGSLERPPQGPLQPREQPLDERMDDAREAARYDVLTGDPSCAFWRGFQGTSPEASYDVEQEFSLFDTLRLACSLPGATDAQRWSVVMGRLRDLADQFAEYAARRIA